MSQSHELARLMSCASLCALSCACYALCHAQKGGGIHVRAYKANSALRYQRSSQRSWESRGRTPTARSSSSVPPRHRGGTLCFQPLDFLAEQFLHLALGG